MRAITVCLLLLFCLSAIAIGPEHVLAVTILKADLAGRTFVAKTLDGTEKTYHFSPQAPISSLAEAAISKSLYGGEGYQFLIHYTIERKEQLIMGFDYVGREAWKSATGAILKVDPATGTIVVKNADGTEISLNAGKYCMVERTAGARSCREWMNGKDTDLKAVVVRYTEVPTGRLAHLLEVTTKTP